LALLNFVSLLIVTPIVAFYLINDWDRILTTVDNWLPREHADTIRELLRQINSAMAGFIRGQGTVCLILGSFYAIALTLLGLNFGLLIGLTAGLLGFVPLVGALVGGALSVGVALVQFWPDWTKVVMVVGVFAAGQFVEGNFLSPKLVGGRIGVHPVWLMFALFAFGYLFGFVGVLLAVPLAAAVGVLCRFAIRQYLASRLYLGTVAAKPRVSRRPPPEAA
jgi:predicted PurR-regulated permease PerM